MNNNDRRKVSLQIACTATGIMLCRSQPFASTAPTPQIYSMPEMALHSCEFRFVQPPLCRSDARVAARVAMDYSDFPEIQALQISDRAFMTRRSSMPSSR